MLLAVRFRYYTATTPSFDIVELNDKQWRHPMAGFACYTTIKRNRVERKRLHEEQRSIIK